MAREVLDPDDVSQRLSLLWNSVHNPAVLAGVADDDCAVFEAGANLIVVSLDFLNATPIAVQLGLGSYWDLGRLLCAANIADLCGSGAEPLYLILGLTFARGTTISEFDSLIAGVDHECKLLGIKVVGGDTKLGSANAFCAAAIGRAQHPDELFLKKRAARGNTLWLSGVVGGCAAAVIALTNPQDIFPADLTWAKTQVLEPVLPLAKSRQLAERRFCCAGTDISDGLGADIADLCRTSRVGAIVDAEAIPVLDQTRRIARQLRHAPWSLAFPTGGDFQFVVAVDDSRDADLISLGFHPIGRIVDEALGLRLRLPSGTLVPLPVAGHRDVRQLTFADEVTRLLREINNDAANA